MRNRLRYRTNVNQLLPLPGPTDKACRSLVSVTKRKSFIKLVKFFLAAASDNEPSFAAAGLDVFRQKSEADVATEERR